MRGAYAAADDRRPKQRQQTIGPLKVALAPNAAALRTAAPYPLRLALRASKAFTGDDFNNLDLAGARSAAAAALNRLMSAAEAADATAPIDPKSIKIKIVYQRMTAGLPQAATYCMGVSCSSAVGSNLLRLINSRGGLVLDLGREASTIALPFTGTDPAEGQYLLDIHADMFESVSPAFVAAVLQSQGLQVQWVVSEDMGIQSWTAEGAMEPAPQEMLRLLPASRYGSDSRLVAYVSGGHAFISQAMQAGQVELASNDGSAPICLRLWRWIPTVPKQRIVLDAAGQAMVAAAQKAASGQQLGGAAGPALAENDKQGQQDQTIAAVNNTAKQNGADESGAAQHVARSAGDAEHAAGAEDADQAAQKQAGAAGQGDTVPDGQAPNQNTLGSPALPAQAALAAKRKDAPDPSPRNGEGQKKGSVAEMKKWSPHAAAMDEDGYNLVRSRGKQKKKQRQKAMGRKTVEKQLFADGDSDEDMS